MPTTLPRWSDLDPFTALPDIEPIGLVPRIEPFDDPGSLFEPKYDGLRAFLYVSRSSCEVRPQPDFGFDRFHDLCSRIRDVLGAREAILDGEVVALGRQGKPGFPDPVRSQDFIAFAAFDLLWLDGTDLRHLPLRERKRLLGEMLPADTGPLYKVLTLDEYGRALFGAIQKMNLEGVVAKRKKDPYDSGTIWYLIKNPLWAIHRGSKRSLRRRDEQVSTPGLLSIPSLGLDSHQP